MNVSKAGLHFILISMEFKWRLFNGLHCVFGMETTYFFRIVEAFRLRNDPEVN